MKRIADCRLPIADLFVIAALCAGLAGCEGYALRGSVVEGPISTVAVVSKNDPRLTGTPINAATLMFTLDPRSGGRKDLGSTYTAHDGSFELPVSATGAGFLEYELQVIARANGKAPVMQTIKLPSGSKRLLITLATGVDRLQIEPDPMQEIRQFMPAK